MMKVKATAQGYFGVFREVGDEFEVPDDTGKSSWFKPVKEANAELKRDLAAGRQVDPALLSDDARREQKIEDAERVIEDTVKRDSDAYERIDQAKKSGKAKSADPI